ncbi:MAG TPA: serine/threonine-protein kinase, partial [Kofleriaceae bacterium]|nr:serine/threonine-protein kinase [Kofleriaceae bacterium]
MADLREVELRIAVAEGVLSRSEADALGDEARRKQQSPLALLVERGRISDESYQSFFAAALNDPVWRAAGHDASGSTYTMLAAPAPISDEPAFPVAAWDRYVNVRFLGQGGMGKVFLAVDARLRREVAIKFVRGDDAEHVRRLIAEARTQAKISHERICRVYEVGEVDGKVYIAMQYIHGVPLGQLSGELTLEQKAMLVRGAAEGIHEAHRLGIIHRDIKPSNIMVERTDDGDIRPYVMDFGLARSAQDAGTTQAGAVLGTPRYMAPEQAHGDPARLDRRADVYSLGATLYHLVTGFPPVDGSTVTEVIHNLMASEPRPLRARDPGIPIDLEAIVLKCLERDRSARYDSARALADDLGRFLDGEPVLARPAGAWYRLRKRLVKHRRLVIVGAVVLVALAVAIGWAIATSREASERERLARDFTERVERIEATATASALAPRHDVRGDRKALRKQMAVLDSDIRDAGEVAAGPGHYALGRGYLALGDDEQARAQLDAAWRDGFREPRAAYALAQALGHLYQRGLLAAERFDDGAVREARKHDAEQRYRDPARDYLSRAEGAEGTEGAEGPPRVYVAALRAFYDGKLDPALAHLDALDGGEAWFYEARQLRGDVLFARAAGFRDRGDTASARADFEAAREAYGEATEIARSAPALYTSLADVEYAAMVMELYERGEVDPLFDRALAATGHALEALPDQYEVLVLQSRVRRSLAEHQAGKGVDVTGLLTSALADAERAFAIDPARVDARLAMAQVHRQWGSVLVDRSDDPSEQFGKVLAISDAIAPAGRDSAYHRNLGLTFSVWAQYLDDRGEDGRARREQAIAAYHSALQYSESLHGQGEFAVWFNLGVDLRLRGSRPHAVDPDGDLQRARDAFRKAKAVFPGSYAPCFYE